MLPPENLVCKGMMAARRAGSLGTRTEVALIGEFTTPRGPSCARPLPVVIRCLSLLATL